MHNYPSDVSREEFEVIRADLENARKKTRPRKTDLYDIFRAVPYVVKRRNPVENASGKFPKMATGLLLFLCLEEA